MAAFRERVFPTWTRLTNINRRARRRTSDRGRLLQTATFICGAVGLDTDLSFAYQLFSLLLCTLIFSRISLKFLIPEVTLKRHLPKYATAGETLTYRISVTNVGSRVERDLRLVDNPKIVPPDLAQFQRSREPGEETRNAYDRWLGFHRFIYLQKLNTGININIASVPDVDLRTHADTTVSATTLRRGTVQFESSTILHPDPLGLNFGTINFSNPESLIVLPKRYEIPRQFEFRGGRHFQPGGVNSTWSIGESDEFVSLRDYRDGDPIRKIHWASSAKREKPVVKEFQDEFFVRQCLVTDCFTQSPRVFEEVISVSASLLTQMESTDGLMDLCYSADSPQILTAGRGFSQTSAQLEALALLQQTASDPEDLKELLSERARLMSGCLFVLAGYDEKRRALVETVRSKGIDTVVFVIIDTPGDTDYPQDVHVLSADDIANGLAAL